MVMFLKAWRQVTPCAAQQGRTRRLRLAALWAAIAGACAVGCEQAGTPVQPADAAATDSGAGGTGVGACTPLENNEFGVGKACTQNADCAGQTADVCVRKEGSDGYGFCTKACVTADAPGWYRCGLGAECVPRGAEPAICAPTVCKGRVLIVPPVVEALVPCNVGQVNSCGVGLLCQTWMDCASFGKGSECPHVVEGEDKAPNFCVRHCGQDSDCCGSAFCWWRKEFGYLWVGNCTPNGCRKPGN